MIFNSPFEYDVIETFVRAHEELVYSICSRTRSPIKLWHLTPKIFFAKIIRLILWSNLAQKFFDLVKVAQNSFQRLYLDGSL